MYRVLWNIQQLHLMVLNFVIVGGCSNERIRKHIRGLGILQLHLFLIPFPFFNYVNSFFNISAQVQFDLNIGHELLIKTLIYHCGFKLPRAQSSAEDCSPQPRITITPTTRSSFVRLTILIPATFCL